jgi:hypothetical protein
MDFRYYIKANETGRPILLFRVNPDAGTEEIYSAQGFVPAPGFLEDIVDGSFDYAPIGEKRAREVFPQAFNA